MENPGPTDSIEVPRRDSWPGTFGAYQAVKPYLKPQIWNLVSVVGLLLIFDLIADIFFRPHNMSDRVLLSFIGDVVSLIIWSFFKATFKIMYFTYLDNKEMSLSEALKKTLHYFLRMLGLTFVIVIILVASIVLLVIPFFFVLPRVYLAPYFLIKNDMPVNQAIAASWHSTKGNVDKVYGIIIINIGLILLCITVIGIPFAIYFGAFNTGSFALLTLYLSQPKKKTNLKSQTT